MYNYGSEARAEEYLQLDENAQKNETAKQVQKKKRERHLKANAIKTLVVVAAILGVILFREAQIDRLCGQISKLKSQEENLAAVVTEKELYLMGTLDLNAVEEAALTRLGMKKPDQYVEVHFVEREGGEILKKGENAAGPFAAFISKAKVFLEYLY